MNTMPIRPSFYFIIALNAFLLSCVNKKLPTSSEEEIPSFRYIDNGTIRLGVDISAGGCIFYFAESDKKRNLLNHFDKGRFIQQSYYGKEDGSDWNGTPWRWNPIQGGGYKGEAAKILKQKISKDHLYISSRPKHWATGDDVEEATMEERISLNGKVAHIQYTFTYTGTITHPAVPQELPAVFVDAALKNLVFYDGDTPWSNKELRSVVPGWPNEGQRTTEHWAAYIDDSGWGVGVYTPGTEELTTYRYEGDGMQGATGSSCSYFAPIRIFSVEPGMVFKYDIYITIGQIDEIRERFRKIHKKDE